MENIILESKEQTATITLNRPKVRNAISPGLIADMHTALDQILNDPSLTSVILTGAGDAFSGGADLANLRAMTEQPIEEARLDSLRFMHFFRTIYEYPLPVIAAVNGPAVGGGCGLASVCDMVVAVEGAKFGYTEVRVGFIPALVSVFLVRICGEKVTRELVMTGRIFTAEEGQKLGLVNRVVPPERLLSTAAELASMVTANSPTAIRDTKQLLKDIQGLNLDEALATAVHINTLTRTTPNFKEGVTAFLEKRRPEWMY